MVCLHCIFCFAIMFRGGHYRMGGEAIRQIVISMANFDWAIAIPFIVCIIVTVIVFRDTDKEVKKQNKILNNETNNHGRSRYFGE